MRVLRVGEGGEVCRVQADLGLHERFFARLQSGFVDHESALAGSVTTFRLEVSDRKAAGGDALLLGAQANGGCSGRRVPGHNKPLAEAFGRCRSVRFDLDRRVLSERRRGSGEVD